MNRKISWLLPGLIVLLQLMAGQARISAATAMIFCNGNDNAYNMGSASGLTTSQINGFRASGFTTMVLFTMSVLTNGDFYYAGQTICTNGVYDGPSNWGSLLAQCKSAPSSVNRIEMGISGAGDSSWTNIKNLIAANGTNATTVLYQNLSALKTALGIDAVDSDDESAFDQASAIKFGRMCGSVGLKMTLCPYNNGGSSGYWATVQSGLGTNCDAIYLQCYDGGNGNDPATWNTYFSGLKVTAGDWDNSRTSSFLTNMMTWSNAGGPGGFLWPSCTGCDPSAGAGEMLQYAGWIQTAFFRFQPAISPASGFNAIADYNFQAQPASTTFTLTNGTASPVSWSLINSSSWLNVSSSSGTIAAGTTTNVTISLNTTVATNLPQNTYAASIVFTNPTLGGSLAENFTLNTAVINWPVALTGFNAAILAGNNATAGAPGATAFDIPNDYCLYQQGLGGSTRGLPLNGVFPSQGDGSTAFQIGPYGAADALMLGDTYPKSGTLTLPSPQGFNSIAILAVSANGGGQGTFVLNFTNGTKSPVLAFNCQDWFGTITNVAIQGFGRLQLGASLTAQDNGSSNPNLYQTTVNLTALGLARPVSSITFSNPANAGATETTAILGLSGMLTSIQLQPPTGLTAIPGTNATVQLSWNGSIGATNYNIKRSTSSGTETTVANTNATSYLDAGLVNGRTYYYVVSAAGVANESANSSEVNATPGPAIAMVDGPSSTVAASFQSASAGISKSFTVSSNATVLVVVWTDKSTASGSQPAPLVWRPAGQTAQNLTQAVTANNGATAFRDNTIYYLYNPVPGTGTITGTANVGVVANGTWLVAYTLNGVNTNTAPLTGSVNNNPGHTSSGNGTSAVTNTVTGVPVNSWAVVSSSLSAGNSDTITLTNGGGTVTTGTDAADGGSGVTMGYISGLATGTDGFMAAGGAANKMVLVEAIFSPPAAIIPPSSPQIVGTGVNGTTLSISATNGTAGGSWTLLQSTDLALPLSQWQTNCAGAFDGNGNLSTNIANTATNGRQFYILKAH